MSLSNFFIKKHVFTILCLFNLLKVIKHFKNTKNNLISLKEKFINNESSLENRDSLEYHTGWKNLTIAILNKDFLSNVERTLYFSNKYVNLVNCEGKVNDNINLKILSKKFNSLFTIAFFPNIVCSNNVKYKDELILISQSIIDILIIIENSKQNNKLIILKLSLLVNKYFNLFDNWQKADKEYLLYISQ